MEYELIYSKRKTLSLKIKEDGNLEVRVPIGTSKQYIDDFLQSKEKWISKHSKEILKRYNLKQKFKLNFNDYVTLRGKATQVVAIEGDIAKYDEEQATFFIPIIYNSKEIRKIIIELYKLIAKAYIKHRVAFFANKMKVNPTGIRITSAKTRWGSCSGKNTVNFSWKLIMADDDTIDYVVVHELAHIKQHNHSPEFWKIVESIIPDYKEKKKKFNI
jgi:predicted metal-dependent hydrolase